MDNNKIWTHRHSVVNLGQTTQNMRIMENVTMLLIFNILTEVSPEKFCNTGDMALLKVFVPGVAENLLADNFV